MKRVAHGRRPGLKNAPNYRYFYALFDICYSCNMKLGDSFQAYHVERVACAHICITGTYAKRSHKNSLRFQKRLALLQQIIFTPLLNRYLLHGMIETRKKIEYDLF